MNFAFRTDTSLQIGTGHVTRCLSLADALHATGEQCHFICREHPENLIEPTIVGVGTAPILKG
jgi:UDP-2,4-diacetamido-2,4,6-trideoxy-beta-L-altropyranose hydrolase